MGMGKKEFGKAEMRLFLKDLAKSLTSFKEVDRKESYLEVKIEGAEHQIPLKDVIGLVVYEKEHIDVTDHTGLS